MRLTTADMLEPRALKWVRTIYDETFTEPNRPAFDQLVRMRRPDEQVLVLVDDHPLAFAALRELGPTSWMFLRYFAVHRNLRGTGIGTQLWGHLREEMLRCGYPRIVFEVEDPAQAGTEAERVVRERRISFYTRVGALLLPVRGYLPPHGDDTRPMLLMAADLYGTRTPPVEGDDLRRVITGVYLHHYGVPEDHPIVLDTLRLSS